MWRAGHPVPIDSGPLSRKELRSLGERNEANTSGAGPVFVRIMPVGGLCFLNELIAKTMRSQMKDISSLSLAGKYRCFAPLIHDAANHKARSLQIQWQYILSLQLTNTKLESQNPQKAIRIPKTPQAPRVVAGQG